MRYPFLEIGADLETLKAYALKQADNHSFELMIRDGKWQFQQWAGATPEEIAVKEAWQQRYRLDQIEVQEGYKRLVDVRQLRVGRIYDLLALEPTSGFRTVGYVLTGRVIHTFIERYPWEGTFYMERIETGLKMKGDDIVFDFREVKEEAS